MRADSTGVNQPLPLDQEAALAISAGYRRFKDDNDDFVPTSEMIQRLLLDNRHIAEQQRRAIGVCDSLGGTPTGNLLQEILDQTERRIWFLYELSQADA